MKYGALIPPGTHVVTVTAESSVHSPDPIDVSELRESAAYVQGYESGFAQGFEGGIQFQKLQDAK